MFSILLGIHDPKKYNFIAQKLFSNYWECCLQKGRSNVDEVEQKAMTVRNTDDDFETNETNQWFLYETCKIQGDVYFLTRSLDDDDDI